VVSRVRSPPDGYRWRHRRQDAPTHRRPGDGGPAHHAERARAGDDTAKNTDRLQECEVNDDDMTTGHGPADGGAAGRSADGGADGDADGGADGSAHGPADGGARGGGSDGGADGGA
jgi:hypothetical protein